MLTLVFLSLGGTIPFLKGQFIPRQRLPVLIGLALLGSIIGALVLLVVPARAIPVVIASAMLLVAGFSLTKHNAGVSVIGDPNRVSKKNGQPSHNPRPAAMGKGFERASGNEPRSRTR
jgi:uncharacterized membrane protein YfcA